MLLSPSLFRSFFSPLCLISKMVVTCSVVFVFRSASISVRLPIHAKPAFFVLAPVGKIPLSSMAILAFGCCSFRLMAVDSPTIPLPAIM